MLRVDQKGSMINWMQVFLCTDLWKDAKILHAAYHDSKGVTEAFIKNGMVHALHALGVTGHSDPHAWTYDVVINPIDRRVCCSFGCPNLTIAWDVN